MIEVAHEDIRDVAATITGILKRLASEWDDLADDMNADASKRLEAALKAAKLHATSAAIYSVVDGSCSMAIRMANAEHKLAAVTDLVTERARIDAKDLGTIDGLIHYAKLITDLKAIL